MLGIQVENNGQSRSLDETRLDRPKLRPCILDFIEKSVCYGRFQGLKMRAKLSKSVGVSSLCLLFAGFLPGIALSQGDSETEYDVKFDIANPDEVVDIKWEELMSAADLDAILNAPPTSHAGYGWEDQLAGGTAKELAFQKALNSFDVNPDLLGKRILLPGFIVPTAYNENRLVTEFFLVPFFGACIHVPPPPPNQIIYVSFEQGMNLDNLYDAYYVLGELSSQVVRNEMAESAYSLRAEAIEMFTY